MASAGALTGQFAISGGSGNTPGGSAGSGGAGPVTRLNASRASRNSDNGNTFTNEGVSGGAVISITAPIGLPVGTTYSFMSVVGTATGTLRFVVQNPEVLFSSATNAQTMTCNNLGGGFTIKKLNLTQWYVQALVGNAGPV